MHRLIRSIVDFDGKVPKEALNVNFQRLQASRLEWPSPIDGKIYTYIRDFFTQNFELPTGATVKDFFEAAQDVEATERLKDIEACQTYTRKNYENLLKDKLEEQNRIKMQALIKDVGEIVTKGRVITQGREKIRLQGTKDGLIYFQRRVHELIPPDTNARTHGDLRDDIAEAKAEYQRAKSEAGSWGAFTGLNNIDMICRGLKRGEMWTHAAFVGELKTMFATNWALNLVTRYRTNVLYVQLEMQYNAIRRQVYAAHSANKRFTLQGKKPLDYRKIRDGELTPEEEAYYDEVLADFESNPDYTRFKVWRPDRDVTMADIRIEAELRNKEMDVGLIVIDHGGLVKPIEPNKDFTIALNSVVRDAKNMASHFDGGQGVPVLMLFQLNRQGKEEAEKADGEYKIKALAYSNEVERSSDVITTSYLDAIHRKNGTTKICNLKNRDNPIIEPFIASVDFGPRRIQNFDPIISTVSGMRVDTPAGHNEMLESMLAAI